MQQRDKAMSEIGGVALSQALDVVFRGDPMDL
jgi:hypothetical protein